MVEIWLDGFDIERVVGNAFYLVISMIVFDVAVGILASARERRVNSSINFNGLIRKGGLIVALAFVTLVDAYFSAGGLIAKVAVGLIVTYECLSIIENLSRIGVDIKFLTKYFDESKVVHKGESYNDKVEK